jgi:hypothetical protein
MAVLDLDNLTLEENARFNSVASEIRQEFNAIVENLSTPYLDDIDWIVGSIASRNKYYSPLYIRLCSLAFVEKELRASSRIDMIVSSDRPLADCLRRRFRFGTRFVPVRCTEGIGGRVWRILRPVRQYLIASALLLLRFLGRSRETSRSITVGRPITLIETFILNNKTGDGGSLVDGKYYDRYYPGLLENLSEEEKRDIFFIPTLIGFNNAISIFRRIRRAAFPFLVHDDFLKLGDYLFALSHPFRALRFQIPEVDFRGYDVASLLRQEKMRNCSDFISLQGLLNYRFAYRLSKFARSGKTIQVRLLVDWNENQVMDRGMIVGFHRFHPLTKVIGYQGYIIAKSLHFYTYPNSTEWQAGAIPDVIFVVGEGLKEALREFCKDVRVSVGPGFRFQGVWRERCGRPDPGAYTVLVALPIDLDTSAEILRLLSAVLPSLEAFKPRFWIKPHPTSGPDVIRPLLPGRWPDEFEFKIGDFHESLERSDLLITNASSVALETLTKGIPVIVVGSRVGIDQNPIPESVPKDAWALIHSAEECVGAIERFRGADASKRREFVEAGSRVRELFFQPVTRENVLRFLDL